MTQSALLLPLRQATRIILPQDICITRLLLKYRIFDLKFRHEILYSRPAVEEILLNRFSECHGAMWSWQRVFEFGAEDYHVGEVTSFCFEDLRAWCGVFPEDTAGREDCFDGADY